MAGTVIWNDEESTPRPVAPFEIIRPDELPEWERRANAAGRTLDHWFPVGGHDDVVAVRMLNSREERDDAQSYRYLGLEPDGPATLT